jgi:hypothetical protein
VSYSYGKSWNPFNKAVSGYLMGDSNSVLPGFKSCTCKGYWCLNGIAQFRQLKRRSFAIEDIKSLKVPNCEIFHLFDFNDFYGIKSL